MAPEDTNCLTNQIISWIADVVNRPILSWDMRQTVGNSHNRRQTSAMRATLTAPQYIIR